MSAHPKEETYVEKITDEQIEPAKPKPDYTKAFVDQEGDTKDVRDIVHSHIKTKMRKKTTERDANLEALKGVERVVELRMRLLGIAAPQRLDISWRKQAESAGLSPDSIIDGIVRNIVDNSPPQALLQQTENLMAGDLQIQDKDNEYDQSEEDN